MPTKFKDLVVDKDSTTPEIITKQTIFNFLTSPEEELRNHFDEVKF
jgi:hypothetical protein